MLIPKTPLILRCFRQKSVIPRQLIRNLYSIDGVFDKYLESSMMVQIEDHWRPKIKYNMKKSDVIKPKYYVLSMFPYPSGKLHMGHVRVYTLSDTFAHYYRMNGYNVIHPMGWDAFGLPAENAAIENKVNPREWTEKNIMKMKEQLIDLGCTFDWERELATCDPAYYKWTQYLFLEMYKAGLVFQKESIVNWDPVDQTVLADEQVDHNGCSWRSGAKVEKRPLNQWFFKTTKFAKSLLEGLNDPTLVSWRDIIKAQSNWIGNCDGTRIEFKVEGSDGAIHDTVSVWTRSPEYICGTEFIALHPEHILNNQYPDKNLHAVNPFTGEKIPILVSEDLEFDYGSQTILGVPSLCNKQKVFADNNNISCNKVIMEEKNGSQYLINSGQFSGMKVDEGREAVMAAASRMDIGGYPVSSNLQDWLISRQRYWGTPIPVIHCSSCGSVPVPEADLPVELPHLDGLTNKGVSPLLEAQDWLNTTCPSCGKPAKRETDTMDTFVDSSWYFLRYLDPQNKEEPFSAEAAKQMPVDLYIGGKEHAYLHMYFARFFTHFLHSIGKLPAREPFSSLITQGMVKGKSYRVKGTKQYISVGQVKEEDGKFFTQDNNTPVVVEWDKMSKSKHNGVDPSLLIDKYGCDTVRMMMLTNVSPQTERNWSEKEYVGMRNLQIKLWKMVSQVLELQDEELPEMRYEGEMEEYRAKLRQARNENLRLINFNYHVTRNTAVIMARISVMTSAAWIVPGQVKRDAPEFQDILGSILICLAPIAPHFCSELWAGLASSNNKTFQDFAWDKSVLEQDWPKLDPTFNLPVKVKGNGQDLCVLHVAKWRFENLTQEDAFDMACHDSTVQTEVLPHDIMDKEFIYNEDFEIVLNLVYNKPVPEKVKLTEEELEQIREKRRLDREAQKIAKQEKKARRLERQKHVQELQKKKAATAVPISEQKKYQ